MGLKSRENDLKLSVLASFSQFSVVKFSLANRASGWDVSTGPASNLLASGIGPTVNFADCFTQYSPSIEPYKSESTVRPALYIGLSSRRFLILKVVLVILA